MMKYIYLTLAFLCLICGSVGIVIPGLPTTPLLLAASFFFAKGSDRFHHWFLGTKLYHKHLESFVFAFSLQPYLPFNISASFL